jgi:hypothetical protein
MAGTEERGQDQGNDVAQVLLGVPEAEGKANLIAQLQRCVASILKNYRGRRRDSRGSLPVNEDELRGRHDTASAVAFFAGSSRLFVGFAIARAL